MTFEQWMSEVDRVLGCSIGLSSADLRDRHWRDLYEDELTPMEAIETEIGDLDDIEEVMMNELFG